MKKKNVSTRIAAVNERRRSNAAGLHPTREQKKTRSQQKQEAIEEQLEEIRFSEIDENSKNC